MVRMRYAVRQKLQILAECSRLQQTMKLSIHSSAVKLGVSHDMLVRWYPQRARFKDSLGTSKAICNGPVGQLDSIKDNLLQ
jgi:hypothetical protein